MGNETMTSQAAIIISFLIYLFFFGWLGWRRGARREITVFLIALVAWLLLQQEGDTIVSIANLGGAALTFAQSGGFTGNQQDAFAAIGSAPTLVNADARTSFLFLVWVALFVGSYTVSNVMIEDKKSVRNGWAILFGILNGLFFAVAFGPSLVALFAPNGEFTIVGDDGLNLSGLLGGGLQLIWNGISSLWGLVSSAGNLGLVALLTLVLVLAATTIRGGGAKAKT
jgi:hypothetical protein